MRALLVRQYYLPEGALLPRGHARGAIAARHRVLNSAAGRRMHGGAAARRDNARPCRRDCRTRDSAHRTKDSGEQGERNS